MKTIELWECSACGAYYADKITACDCYMDGCTTFHHYHAALTQAGNSPVIPDGYVMVPKEPTEVMLHKSGCQHHAWDDPDCAMRQTRRLIWSHMLTAALREVES